MAYFKSAEELRTVMGGFLLAFPRLDPVLRMAVDAEPMSLKLELKQPALAVEIDLAQTPLAVTLDSDSTGAIAMAGPADAFHDLLLGKTSMAVAINQKLLLVRGPTSKLMKSAPLFFLAPSIYPFYLKAIGRPDLAGDGRTAILHAPPKEEDPMNALISKLAWLIGYALGLLKKTIAPNLDIVSTLESLGQGLKKASP